MPSGRRHYRITWADAVSAHARALQTGGRDGISDRKLILSAIGRPYTGYYLPLANKAAALVQSVATNHGFIDGNKRTTVILAHLLIERSGYRLVPLQGEELEQIIEDLVLSVVCRNMDFDQLVGWFEQRLRRRRN